VENSRQLLSCGVLAHSLLSDLTTHVSLCQLGSLQGGRWDRDGGYRSPRKIEVCEFDDRRNDSLVRQRSCSVGIDKQGRSLSLPLLPASTSVRC
jgi:hypothetical protein